jgi:hypothetical protein
MQPAHNQFQMAVAAGFQQLGIAFNPAHLAFQLQPAMTWATFSQSIQDHMTLDPKHGVHSALSIRSQSTVNAASLANPSSSSSSSSSSFFSSHDSFPEPKRQHLEPDYTAYAANAAPSYEELQTRVAEYERQTQPYDGGFQYPPQQPNYQQFQQIQQYWQQGAQFPPRHDSYAPRGGAAGGRSQQPAHDGYQQQPQQQQQQGHGGYNRDNQQQLQRGRGRRPNLGRRNHYPARVKGAAIDTTNEENYN